MNRVIFKERRFSNAYVEECKLQSQLPESECDYAPMVEGVLACPEDLRPKKKALGMTPQFTSIDQIAYIAEERTPSGRIVKPFNPPMHELPREPKRVSQHHLSKLNTNNAHIQDGQFIEKPKKVTGFENLRDLIGGN